MSTVTLNFDLIFYTGLNKHYVNRSAIQKEWNLHASFAHNVGINEWDATVYLKLWYWYMDIDERKLKVSSIVHYHE